MLDFWLDYLPVVIYFLLIALIIVLIILGLRAINTLTKVDKVIDNVNEKFDSIRPFFQIVDFAADRLSSVTDVITDIFTGLLGKIIGRKEMKKDEEE